MKNQKGFSLIELLIVVVIIGIIAAIAIPNLLAARRSANEGSAVSAVRNLHSAQISYQATTGNGTFATALANLGPDPAGGGAVGFAGLIDLNLAKAVSAATTKSGYFFETALTAGSTPATFHVAAVPGVATGVTATGTRKFGTTQVGVIYGGTGTLTVPLTFVEMSTWDAGTALPADVKMLQ